MPSGLKPGIISDNKPCRVEAGLSDIFHRCARFLVGKSKKMELPIKNRNILLVFIFRGARQVMKTAVVNQLGCGVMLAFWVKT